MFDPTKPVQTRDGRKARIICRDAHYVANGTSYPLVALIEGEDGMELPFVILENGERYSKKGPASGDLINVPPKAQWANINSQPPQETPGFLSLCNVASLHETREAADDAASEYRIACIRFIEGEGIGDQHE